MLLINSNINLLLTWSKKCVLPNSKDMATFTKAGTKLS